MGNPISDRKAAKKIRSVICFIFAVLLIVNVIINTIGIVAARNAGKPFSFLPLDTSFGSRLLLFIILGIVVSWLAARMVYNFMLRGRRSVDESADTSFTVMFYILLTIGAVAFWGVLGWFWLPILLVVLFTFSLFTLWKLLGTALALLAIVLAAIACICTYLLASVKF